MVESSSEDILAGAAEVDVAFLVVGDPFGCVMTIFLFEMYFSGKC
jgi:diphthamide biosynthesis methyltransferase